MKQTILILFMASSAMAATKFRVSDVSFVSDPSISALTFLVNGRPIGALTGADYTAQAFDDVTGDTCAKRFHVDFQLPLVSLPLASDILTVLNADLQKRDFVQDGAACVSASKTRAAIVTTKADSLVPGIEGKPVDPTVVTVP